MKRNWKIYVLCKRLKAGTKDKFVPMKTCAEKTHKVQ